MIKKGNGRMQHLNHREGMNYGSEDDDAPLGNGITGFQGG